MASTRDGALAPGTYLVAGVGGLWIGNLIRAALKRRTYQRARANLIDRIHDSGVPLAVIIANLEGDEALEDILGYLKLEPHLTGVYHVGRSNSHWFLPRAFVTMFDLTLPIRAVKKSLFQRILTTYGVFLVPASVVLLKSLNLALCRQTRTRGLT